MKIRNIKLNLNLEVVASLEVAVKYQAEGKKWEGKKAGDVGEERGVWKRREQKRTEREGEKGMGHRRTKELTALNRHVGSTYIPFPVPNLAYSALFLTSQILLLFAHLIKSSLHTEFSHMKLSLLTNLIFLSINIFFFFPFLF
jgi:hypothetical protein